MPKKFPVPMATQYIPKECIGLCIFYSTALPVGLVRFATGTHSQRPLRGLQSISDTLYVEE